MTALSGPKSNRKKWWIPYLFVLPLLLLLGTFKIYSSVYAMVMSLFEWNGGRTMRFIGIQNFVTMFSDQTFGRSLVNLMVLVVTSVIKVVTIPLIVAEVVMRVRSRRAANAYKYMFVVPMIIPSMVVILLWKWVYDYNGLLNGVLSMLGFTGAAQTAWLGNADTALGSIVFYNFPWVAGIQFLIFLSGLQNIPDSLYEAAALDGVGPVRRMFTIDIPLLTGQFRYLIITTVSTAFQSFEYIMILTNGGPGKTTMVPALYLYQEAFSYFRMGYACALGMALFAITLVITGICMRAIKGSESMG